MIPVQNMAMYMTLRKSKDQFESIAELSVLPCSPHGDLLANAGLDEGRIRLDLGGDSSRSERIEEGDVLAEDGLEIVLANPPRSTLASPRPGEHVDVGSDDCEEARARSVERWSQKGTPSSFTHTWRFLQQKRSARRSDRGE
jgi:hypothetical protein